MPQSTLKKKEIQIDQFQYIKIKPKTIDLSTRLWGIITEFVVNRVKSGIAKEEQEQMNRCWRLLLTSNFTLW